MPSQRLQHYLAELRQWVEIETPTSDRIAVSSLLERVAGSCGEAGLAVEWAGGEGGAPKTLIARGDADGDKPALLVLAHLDTVHPTGSLAKDLPWRIDGDRLYGPGVYDMKGSALMALCAWRRLRASGRRPGTPVTFLFSPDEEIGSPSSRAVIEQEARKAFAAFVVEPARDGGKIVLTRKGVARFTITATGRAAHAGTNFEDGRNAISEMAAQIAALDAITDIGEGITVNVGVIGGGTGPNTIAETCVIEVDVRLNRDEQVAPVINAIRSLTSRNPDVTLRVEGGLNRPPFVHGPASQAMFARARHVAARQGIDLVGVHAGGGSDGNFTAALGLPTLDGLGVDGYGAHSNREHIVLSSVLPRIDLFCELLAEPWLDGRAGKWPATS